MFACLSAALSIGASAMAAHAQTLSLPDAQALAWALDMQRFHALALLVVVLLAAQGLPRSWATAVGALFVAGTLLFSVQIALRVLFGIVLMRPLVPFGGMAFMAGWLALAMGGWRMQRPKRT